MRPVVQPCGDAVYTLLHSHGLFPTCMNTLHMNHFQTLAPGVNKLIEDITMN